MSVSVTVDIKRTNHKTGEIHYYDGKHQKWVNEREDALPYDEETATATIRCLEARDRRNRVSDFTYDTLVIEEGVSPEE